MALKSDAQGFLAGEPIDIGTALGMWRNIGADVRAIRQSLVGNIGRASVVAPKVAASSAQQRYESARAVQRDERGRFVRPGNSPSQVRLSSVPSSSGKGEKPIVLATPAASVRPSSRRLSLPFSSAGMDGVDPAVAAFNEIAQPLVRGWEMVGNRGGDDKKQVGLLRRIFGALNGSQKDDSAFQKAARRSLGVIEGNTEPHSSEGAGGWIAGLLSKLGLTSLAPILATVASVLGTLSLAMAPLIALWKAKNWAEDQKHDTERVEDIQKKAAEPAKEVLKKVGIDKDKEIEAIREKNRAEQNGTEEYARMDRAKASFAASEANRAKFEGLKAGSPEFDAKWREMTAAPGFNKDFEKHYAEVERKETAPKKGWIERQKDKLFGTSNPVGKVVETGAGFNVVQRPDGSVEKQVGARNWRNNNPGNIEAGKFADKHGAIGSDGRFAIFPSYEAGRNAKEKLIFDGAGGKRLSTKADYGAGLGYKDKLLTQAIAAYAPPEDKNNLPAYQGAVLSSVGGKNKRMSEYTPEERQLIMDAMQRQEGFKRGKVVPVPSMAKAVQPPAQSIVASSPTPSAPKMAAAPVIGDAPPVVAPIGSGGGASNQTTVIQQKDAGQDLSDRKIAHIVTGGLSSAY